MNKKSYIKDDAFYVEADDMQEGWGNTLRHIDELKDKIQYNKEITLNDFCYSLYGDGYCSHCWQAFILYCERDVKYADKQLVYDCWKGLFDKWVKTEYDVNKFYE